MKATVMLWKKEKKAELKLKNKTKSVCGICFDMFKFAFTEPITNLLQ